MKKTNLIFGLVTIILIAWVFITASRACSGRETGKVVSSKKDLRSAVASVRVEATQPLQAFFYKMASDGSLPEWQRTGALRFIASANGGSGFAVQVYNGHSLIVTNEHVVGSARAVDISFNEGFTWHRGTAVYSDASRDVAIVDIAHESAYRFKLGTNFRDMDSVVAVGLPYLTDGPTYQVTPGFIANECFSDRSVFGSTLPCLIHHTSFINPGSSGGPLLREKDWSVVGINSYQWGRMFYDGVYLAVPSTEIHKVLMRAQVIQVKSGDREWRNKEMQDTCQRFFEELGSADPDPENLSHISDALIVAQGWEAFESWESKRKQYWFSRQPYAVLKLALLNRVRADIRSAGLFGDMHNTFRSCRGRFRNDDLLMDQEIRLVIELLDGTRETAWRFEGGTWRLARYHI